VHDVAKVEGTTESAQHRFVVKQDGRGPTWVVWDGLLKRPAVLKAEKLEGLAFSAAEALGDTLNADLSSD
jgi:hypothetical protein